mmetsp:Transcript_27612/g.51502  ORF Transcript_27612/g.51502 Transcript_27612/m.51502 type:complete len:309 (-) Transcript_27612:206-1132(-)
MSKATRARPGIYLLEHVNLNILDRSTGVAFYCELLGCQENTDRPKERALHSNCGYLTQFHTQTTDAAQLWRGPIEVVYTEEELRKVAERAKASTVHTGFTALPSGAFRVTCPYGNEIILRTPGPAESKYFSDKTNGARPLSDGSAPLGLAAATVRCAPGTARGIAKFYLEVFQFPIQYEHRGANGLPRTTVFTVGGAQHIYFEEHKGVDVKEDNGEHLAIYIGDYEECFKRCQKHGVVWVNPRFTHLDNTRTLEEAVESRNYRIRDIVDTVTGELLLRLEHEVRALDHFRSPLPTATKGRSSHQQSKL